jgi:hypothetical protein
LGGREGGQRDLLIVSMSTLTTTFIEEGRLSSLDTGRQIDQIMPEAKLK